MSFLSARDSVLHLFKKEDNISSTVFNILLIVVLVSCICVPVLAWIDTPKFVQYLHKWEKFQVGSNWEFLEFIFNWKCLNFVTCLISAVWGQNFAIICSSLYSSILNVLQKSQNLICYALETTISMYSAISSKDIMKLVISAIRNKFSSKHYDKFKIVLLSLIPFNHLCSRLFRELSQEFKD